VSITVAQLIEDLKLQDPSRIVVLSKDAEGNNYAPLHAIDTASYSDGEIGLEKLTKEDEESGYTEEDVVEGKPAVVLWPE